MGLDLAVVPISVVFLWPVCYNVAELMFDVLFGSMNSQVLYNLYSYALEYRKLHSHNSRINKSMNHATQTMTSE